MKKNIIFLMIALAGFMFAGVQSANAQMYGEYHVTVEWNDDNCDCSDPVTKRVRVVITSYPGGDPVDDSGWKITTSSPYTYDGDVNLDDCAEPCYTVTVYIAYSDNSGPCCAGYDSDNVTGFQLFEGITFTGIILD